LRLITFTAGAGVPRIGLVRNGSEVIDLAALGGTAPFDTHDMISLIAAGSAALS
jgi:hypothetical protein